MKEGELKKRREREKFQIVGKIKPDRKVKSLEGFKVMANVAGTKKQLGSAITDVDGTYEIKFEYDEPVDVNISVCPDVNEAMLKVIPKAKHFVPKDAWVKRSPYSLEADIPLSEPTILLWERTCQDYTIVGVVRKVIPDPVNPGSYLDPEPIPDVTVHIYEVSHQPFSLIESGFSSLPPPPPPPPPPPQPSRSVCELGSVTTGDNGVFVFDFTWYYQEQQPPYAYPGPDVKPDIRFKVFQNVNDFDVLLYEEDLSETHWDIETTFGVSLIVEGDVIVPDDPMPDIVDKFEFQGIGNVLVSDMNDDGYVSATKSPFGSTIHVKGQFKNELHGKYYQVLYAKWANDETEPIFPDDFAPILNEEWPVAQMIGGMWVTVSKSPTELPGGIKGCYEIPYYTDLSLTLKDVLIRWSTHRMDFGSPKYPDGKYTLKVKAFKDNGNEISFPTIEDKELIVRIDNTWPVAIIKDIGIVGGEIPLCADLPPGSEETCDDPEECGIVYIELNKEVRIKFDAYDEQNHFRSYKLTYRTGGDVVTIATSSGSNDYGYTDETVDWDIGGLKQCGYEIKLEVRDRTTNGYFPIHRTDDFLHLILLET
jgi:hypothetical protein